MPDPKIQMSTQSQTVLQLQSGDLPRVIGGTVWALALSVLGLWIGIGTALPGFLQDFSQLQQAAIGIGMLCGGQLIFLMCVAQRVFPRTPIQLVACSHWGLGAIGFVCLLVVTIPLMISGGS